MAKKKTASSGLGSFSGCMLGCAAGDALGAEFEGTEALELEPSHFSGRWTDDTHMMIGVAESLIECNGFDGHHMTIAFIRNHDQEPWRGYASGPPLVFKWIKSGVQWNEASKKLFGGAGSLGNGAAMRTAPIGLLYYDNSEELRRVAYEASLITHAHELGKEGAAIQAYAVALAVNMALSSSAMRLKPIEFLKRLKSFTRSETYLQKFEKVGELLGELSKSKIVRELGNSVEAHNSVPTAIYSFLRNPESFRDATLYAVSLGGDADTIAAMTGSISGAYLGIEAIPREWINVLERKDYIEKLAKNLWRTRERRSHQSLE
nr:ADP-ribosylglycohydrolase family protein [Candidatus Njordarchaeota archaeon]